MPAWRGSEMPINGSLQIIEKHPHSANVDRVSFPLNHSIVTVIHVFFEPWRSLQTLIFFALSTLALRITEQADRNHLAGEDLIKYKKLLSRFLI